MRPIKGLAPAIAIILGTSLSYADGPGDGNRTTEIGRTTEKEISVVLSSSFGTVIIRKGEPEKILVAESAELRDGSPLMNVDYSIRNRVGYADISLGEADEQQDHKKGTFRLKNFDKGKWYLRFSDALPISFDVELGVGRGDINLSGLNVKDFNLTTGASDVTLAFDEPNTGRIENLNIESGVSKFDGRSLCNANFRRFSFKGGVGTYTLDFSGKLSGEVDVDIEVGLGLLTVVIPDELGVKVAYEKSWMSRLDCDKDFQASGENRYLTTNYYSAAGKMNINVDSGLGNIKIRRR